eukprot:7748161-Alexandrium_andersonii.AAC.1
MNQFASDIRGAPATNASNCARRADPGASHTHAKRWCKACKGAAENTRTHSSAARRASDSST